MSKLFKFLGFVLGWIAPFVVVYVNHVVVVDGYEIEMFGLLLIFAIVIGFIKWTNKKMEVYEIQDRNKVLRLIWNNGKKILLSGGLTWMLFTIEDNLPKLQWTAVLITICFVGGFVLTLLGNLKRKKELKEEATKI